MRKVILYLSLFILITSCGARKVNKTVIEEKSKIDSTSVIKTEIVTTQENNVIVTEDTDELEIFPIDTTRSITIDGKKYHNVKIKKKKQKKVIVDNTKIKVAEKSDIKVSVVKEKKANTFKKNIDKKESLSSYLWWILILICLGFYAYKRINRTLF